MIDLLETSEESSSGCPLMRHSHCELMGGFHPWRWSGIKIRDETSVSAEKHSWMSWYFEPQECSLYGHTSGGVTPPWGLFSLWPSTIFVWPECDMCGLMTRPAPKNKPASGVLFCLRWRYIIMSHLFSVPVERELWKALWSPGSHWEAFRGGSRTTGCSKGPCCSGPKVNQNPESSFCRHGKWNQ